MQSLPQKELIPAELLEEASFVITTFQQALEAHTPDPLSSFPVKEAEAVVDAFKEMNNGMAMPLQASLASPLQLTNY